MAEQRNPVNWFEVPVSDMDRAVKFYEALLGVKLSLNDMGPLKMAWFPMYPGVPGAAGSLVLAEPYTPSHAGTLVYFQVDDIGAALGKVEGLGGKILGDKKAIGEFGFVAYLEDTEGNRVALHAKT